MTGSATSKDREEALHADKAPCALEQHYEYRWDELNRLSEARRWDQTGGAGWALQVRQRYRYDASNVRTVKQTLQRDALSGGTFGTLEERIALYVYPGDFEVRGLQRGGSEYEDLGGHVEAQYVVAGARLVWQFDEGTAGFPAGETARHQRFTAPLTDIIQTTSATLDLLTGELVESRTYYPNGAPQTVLDDAGERSALEPMGFTGKEGEEEVGLTYFGQRHLVARVGRWASPDPLHVHAAGGGEALNAYHYVGGNLLVARDPLGLDIRWAVSQREDGSLELVARQRIVVYARDEGVEAQTRDAVDRQQDFWRNGGEARETTLADGRRVSIRFEVEVVTSREAGLYDEVDGIAGGRTMSPSDIRDDVVVGNATRGGARQSVTHRLAGVADRRGDSIVIAGVNTGTANTTGPHNQVTYYGATSAERDQLPVGPSAHENGHTMGLGERYAASDQGASVTFPRQERNVMGAFVQDQRASPGARVWVGQDQLRYLAEGAVAARGGTAERSVEGNPEGSSPTVVHRDVTPRDAPASCSCSTPGR